MFLPASLLHASFLIPDFSPPWSLFSVCPRWNLAILEVGPWVVGAVPVRAWPRLFPSSSFFPPTWMGQAVPAGIPKRSPENVKVLALLLGFGQALSQGMAE